jgi:methanogenic corrinoid protein MtbC1
VQTIESEIIPRLVIAHRDNEAVPGAVVEGGVLDSGHVDEFCALVVRSELDVLIPYVRRTWERGVPLERIYLELLAPTARRLGEMWLADECDFTTVTLGLWRLHRVLHELSATFQRGGEPSADDRRVLLAATPGEQHTFGLFMVAEFFRRAGWNVFDGPSFSARELAAAVHHEWFAIAGFSLSRADHLGDLSALIREVKQASRNRGIGILVGGVVFGGRPDLVAQVGADGSAGDGQEAVRLAETFWSRRERRGLD